MAQTVPSKTAPKNYVHNLLIGLSKEKLCRMKKSAKHEELHKDIKYTP
jgi:hypothetical protein